MKALGKAKTNKAIRIDTIPNEVQYIHRVTWSRLMLLISSILYLWHINVGAMLNWYETNICRLSPVCVKWMGMGFSRISFLPVPYCLFSVFGINYSTYTVLGNYYFTFSVLQTNYYMYTVLIKPLFSVLVVHFS